MSLVEQYKRLFNRTWDLQGFHEMFNGIDLSRNTWQPRKILIPGLLIHVILMFSGIKISSVVHANVILLLTGGLVHWVSNLTEWRRGPTISDFLYFFCRHYSSGLLVFMSIKKLFALYFPLKSKLVCTVKAAKFFCADESVPTTIHA